MYQKLYVLITKTQVIIITGFLFILSIHYTYSQISTPTNFKAISYDSHIELTWSPNYEPDLSGYKIYKATPSSEMQYYRYLSKLSNSYIDFVGRVDSVFSYQIVAVDKNNNESVPTQVKAVNCSEMTDEELLTMVQEYTFRYFWDFAHPVSGLARERNTTSIVTIGGSGFGVMAILVGIERGFISYEEGNSRMHKIVDFLTKADRFHGVWPHWMNGATGKVVPFSTFDNGGDLVETAFMVQGLLTARQFFQSDTELYDKITSLWEGVEWDWYRQNNQNKLFWHWSPEYGWKINMPITGFNEAQIIYILAIASPTHGVPAYLYHQGWAGNNYENPGTFFGHRLEVGTYRGGPLFFSHYSYLGFDPRNKKDKYTNYFIRNTNHTYINHDYCVENPKNYEGYDVFEWGLTASDDPFGYLAHAPVSNRDNGTISPTAAISSMPYTPYLSIETMKHFYRDLGDKIWGKYGFTDAFNKHENWYATSYLAIDQGPIIGMIENYRTQLLWTNFMKNPEINTALDKIGFTADTTTNIRYIQENDIQIYPNPFRNKILIKTNTDKEVSIFDIKGKSIITKKKLTKGDTFLDTSTYKKGIYIIHIADSKNTIIKKLIKID